MAKPINLSEPTAQLTSRIQGAYSDFRPDQVQEYRAGFKRMMEEFGYERTNQAITRAIDAIPDFAPKIGRIRQYVPAAISQRETCAKCADSEGYTFVDKYTVKLCPHVEGK